jgi:hypothetical protein
MGAGPTANFPALITWCASHRRSRIACIPMKADVLVLIVMSLLLGLLLTLAGFGY